MPLITRWLSCNVRGERVFFFVRADIHRVVRRWNRTTVESRLISHARSYGFRVFERFISRLTMTGHGAEWGRERERKREKEREEKEIPTLVEQCFARGICYVGLQDHVL